MAHPVCNVNLFENCNMKLPFIQVINEDLTLSNLQSPSNPGVTVNHVIPEKPSSDANSGNHESNHTFRMSYECGSHCVPADFSVKGILPWEQKQTQG